MMALQIGDIFFTLFHTVFILFNLFGWIWPATRRWNLAALLLTGLSWSVAGIWYGLGYCPLTDWHFQILDKLGHQDLPLSYIQFLIKRISGWDTGANTADIATGAGYATALLVSGYFNLKGFWKKTYK
jgi:hypothetical protein